MKIAIEEIAVKLNAKATFSNRSDLIETLLTDSRRVNDPQHSLFFALSAQKDGHAFIKDAYEKKIRNFIVSKLPYLNLFPEANFLVVEQPLKALQQLAALHRQEFNFPIIGITGSNGKTIVKEWLFQLLAPDYSVVRNPRSYNSQIGVPISVWQINSRHNLGIFEAGISTTAEMESLEAVIKPNIGILTNIGDAHNQGFESHEEKLAEKIKLFKNADWVIIRSQDKQLLASADAQTTKFISWGRESDADLRIIDIKKETNQSTVKAYYKAKEIEYSIPFVDQASIENSICCWLTLLSMEITPETAAARLAKLNRVGMRMELKPGINRCSIIDDSYSADIPSLSIALDFLNQQNQHERRTLILSDLVETGRDSKDLYKEISNLVRRKNINRLIGVGQEISKYQELFSMEKQFFQDTEAFLDAFPALKFADESILIKGARKFQFERISKLLTLKTHDTVLEINLEAMTHNLNYYRSKLHDQVKLMVMVKAFSYGSGSFEIANLLQFHKVDYLAVAYADEGVALVKSGIQLPIMVMSPEPSAFDTLVKQQLQPELYSLEVLNAFIEHLPDGTQDYPIHIKLDTGMHRLGFEDYEDSDLVQLLLSTSKVKVVSVFTHLVGSGNPDLLEFTQQQIDQFKLRASSLEARLGRQVIKHVLNTSGIVNFPDAQLDMVRLGIGLYGYDASLESSALLKVTTLKTTVTQVKCLKSGESVGYDRQGFLPNGGTIATVRIGYADGYSRAFGKGKGQMLVNGHRVPTIGSICMDMCMLDVTGLNVKQGDEVIVFNSELTIEELSEQINTIPYEILTNVSQRVKRVYFYE